MKHWNHAQIRHLAAIALVFAGHTAAAASYDCLMEPTEIVNLGSSVSGLLDEVLVARGDSVSKGDVVAQLNSAIEQATVDLLRTRATSTSVIDAQSKQLEMIERRFARVAQLRDNGFAAEETFDQVEAEHIAAQSLLTQAELNREFALHELARAEVILGQRQIISSIDGIVSKRVLSPGEYVGSDDHVLEIVQLNPLKIEAFLPVFLYGAIEVGNSFTIHPVEPLTGTYIATVTSVDKVFDAASGTFVVVLELPNPDEEIPAGHRCVLVFETG